MEDQIRLKGNPTRSKKNHAAIEQVKALPFTLKELLLIRSTEMGNIDAVYASLWDNADVNSRLPNIGTTPLMMACQNGHFSIASLLIEFGATIRVSDSYGVTVLHWYCFSYIRAANSGVKKLVAMLMIKGRLGLADLGTTLNLI